jgi:hypothetical protein
MFEVIITNNNKSMNFCFIKFYSQKNLKPFLIKAELI